jgi:hypothetical protein
VWFGVLCLTFAGHGEEFQFFLRNGDRLTGALVAEDSQRLTLTNAVLGTVTLPLAEIQRRERLSALTSGKIDAAAAKANSPAAAQSTAAPPKPLRLIAGEIQAGADLGYGTKNRSLYTGRFKLNYSQSSWSNQVDYLFTYGQTEDELSANQMYGSVKTDYRLFFLTVFDTIRFFSIFFRKWANLVAGLRAVWCP